MALETEYKHLEARPGSNYRQLFVKGRRIRAVILYDETRNAEPRTPEQVAADYDIPLDAVLEAVDYCERHADVIEADWRREEETLRRYALDEPPHAPSHADPNT